MTSAEAARILLVRAIEESRPEAIAPAVRIDALTSAGEPADTATWFARRAAYLLTHARGGYHTILGMTEVPHRLALAAFAAGLVVGLAANSLGPSAKIHVVWNPMSVLIAWNLGAYVLLGLHTVWRPRWRQRSGPTPPAPPPPSAPRAPAAPFPTRALPAPPPTRLPWWFRPLVPAFWLRWQRVTGEARASATGLAEVARGFWGHWLTVARALLETSARRTLHGGAIGVAVGAVIGMYVRGLFLEYNMVWRSTFIRDFEHVHALLAVLLAPAAFVLGQPLPPASDTALLLTPAGAPAARWIHLYAAATALFVIAPRVALAAAAWLRERRLATRVELDLAAPYYRRVLDRARALHLEQLAQAIEEDVREACADFASAVATFVCGELFDRRIVPHLVAFRAGGGRIADLEESVRGECTRFEVALVRYLPTAQADLERTLARRVERSVGRALAVETGPTAGLASGVGRASERAMVEVGTTVGREVADAVALAASAAAAVAAGTVSGGFGKSLGVAIVAVLLHTTGPVGFVIGALGGLALAGAGWWLGRERLAESMKHVALPAAVAGLVLRQSSLERIVAQGRERCREAVTASTTECLGPLTPTIAEQIWTRVKPILGAERG